MHAKKSAGKKTGSKKEPSRGEANHETLRVLGFLEKKLHETRGKTSRAKNEMISAAEEELAPRWSKHIQTDYDQVLEFVKSRKTVRVREIMRELKLSAERIEEKLKILEENNLVEVKYPAIGGAIISYKIKKEE